MPTDQEWRRIERDRADQHILRRAAAWLRHDPGRPDIAGLSWYQDALALAELLMCSPPRCPMSTPECTGRLSNPAA